MDALDPSDETLLFPGTNTDGVYTWPIELAHYVRKYHVPLPAAFVAHMASRDWRPPSEGEIDWDALGF